MTLARRPPWLPLLLVLSALLGAGLACTLSGQKVIYVTATPEYDEAGLLVLPPTFTPDEPTPTPRQPTPNPPRYTPTQGGVHAVRPGETLGTIADLYQVTVDQLLAINTLENPNALEVGQLIRIPGGTLGTTPAFKIIPDSELVYGPSASDFSIVGAVKFRQGFLRAYSEAVGDETWSGVKIVDFVARNYSVNPRLLLALLEYRGQWLSNPYPSEDRIQYPLGIVKAGREGLLKQLLDAADALNYGYYGWKYRGTIAMTLGDSVRLLFEPTLNAGTVAVQYMLSLTNSPEQWQRDVHPSGFFQTYLALFGDPFARPIEPIVPPNLVQPTLTLPFAPGEEWVFTGGPHGGYNSGSAWAAIDFAPPEPPEEIKLTQGACYVSPNWVTAAAPGIIARSGDGYVILDLDGDGNEHTGWTLVYLHIDDFERIPAGTVVQTGDRLGHPSCQGGFSNGTHLHLARRYNGEWIPVECEDCAPGVTVPPFVLGEWTVHGFPNQEYQGYLTRPGDDGYRQADQMREFAQNKVIW